MSRVVVLMAALPLCALAENQQNFELKGQMDLGAWSELSFKQGEYYPLNYGNADLRLSGSYKLDEGVRAFAGLRAVTLDSMGLKSQIGFGRASASAAQPLALGLREFGLEWEMTPGLRMGLGRYAYGFGAVNHPLFKDLEYNSALLRERTLSGVSLQADNMRVFVGIPQGQDRAIRMAGEGRFDLIQESNRQLSVSPAAELNLYTRHQAPWTLGSGVDFAQKYSNDWRAKIHGVGAVYGNSHQGDNHYGVLLESAFDYASKFSVGLSAWNGFLASEDSASLADLPMSVNRFAKLELSVPFAGRFSADLPVSWNDVLSNVSGDDFLLATPGLSFYANGQAEFRTWGGVRWADQPYGPFQNHGLRGIFGLDASVHF